MTGENPEESYLDAMISELSPQSIALQEEYNAKNSNSIDEKWLLDKGADGSHYSEVHNKYHSLLKKGIIDKYDFKDLFIIDDKSGNIIYSTFKGISFGANLKSSHFATSPIGKLYAKLVAIKAADSEDASVAISPVDRNFASYQESVMFMGAPIKENGTTLGYLITQVPMQKIENQLTNSKQWKETGMGKTGELLLIDPENNKLVSASRSLLTEKEDFFKKIQYLKLDFQTVNLIKTFNTSASAITFNNNLLKLAADGKDAIGETTDFLQDDVILAAKNFFVGDNKFILVSKIDKDEAFESIYHLLKITALSILSILVVLTLAAKKLAKGISHPIIKVSEGINQFKEGILTTQVQIKGTDEVSTMAMNFDVMMKEMHSIFQIDKVDWGQVSKQKIREAEAKKQVEEALKIAESEKREALIAQEMAVEEQSKAKQAMLSAEEAKKAAEELALNEKKAAILLQQKVDQILDVVNHAKQGDLTKEIEVAGTDAIGQLASGLKSFFIQLREDFINIEKVALDLTQSSNQLEGKAKTLDQNSVNNLDKTRQMKEMTESVNYNIANLNRSTSEMRQAIDEISKQAIGSSSSSNEAVKLVSLVQNLVKTLESNTEDISGFLGFINNIARQTNLLALNATIEAARAGEAGRGFAVVANEVKELAHQSSDAASQITEKVSTIKSNTNEIISSIEKVSAIMDSLSVSSKVVASATEEQSATTMQFQKLLANSVKEVGDINSGIIGVNETTFATSEIVKDNLNISSEVNSNATTLSKVVSKFKLKTGSEKATKISMAS